MLASVAAGVVWAAEVGVATLVEGRPRLLRTTTWYKVVPGTGIEASDIVEAGEREQLQIEFAGGSVVNLVGGALYLVPPTAPSDGLTLAMPRGWLKAIAAAPGLRLRAASVELALGKGVVVVQTDGARLDTFVESGVVRLGNPTTAADSKVVEGRHDEFWSKSASGAFVPSSRAPRAFIEAMPRHFLDPLPAFAAKYKTRAAPVADREISYAEAQPWLAGRDRAVFERRFAPRLADPAFRKAVEPDVARYPNWDRRLHPEKYAPPPEAKR